MDAAVHQDNRGRCSILSRFSRFGLLVKCDVPERLLIVASPCQSEIKLTLKPAAGSRAGTRWGPFRPLRLLHSMQMVNDKFPAPARYGFESVHIAATAQTTGGPGNEKFTENPLIGILCKFSTI